MTPNVPANDHLIRDNGLVEDPLRVDQSEMTVQTLGPDVYLVGQEDYSLFVAHDGGFIAVNPYAGLQERYDALREIARRVGSANRCYRNAPPQRSSERRRHRLHERSASLVDTACPRVARQQ